jgi:hypothetical protein
MAAFLYRLKPMPAVNDSQDKMMLIDAAVTQSPLANAVGNFTMTGSISMQHGWNVQSSHPQ